MESIPPLITCSIGNTVMLGSNADFLLKEIEKCNFCGICEENCSVFLANHKFPPHEKLIAVLNIAKKTQKPVNWDSVFLCTKCEVCETICPQDIPITRILDLGRSLCVEKWGVQYSRQKSLIDNILKFGNPFGKEESRTGWFSGKINDDSDTVLHLGCMMSYSLNGMGQSLIKLLRKLDIDFTISPKERCCGYFVFNTGNHEAVKEIIQFNTGELNQYKNIITACAGCYTFMKEYYPLKVKINHVIEVIFEKIKDLKLDLGKTKTSVVFQDSCHIARPHGIIEPPRKILEKIGVGLQQFDKSLCCGANGGMRIIDPSLALEIGKQRLLEAKSKSDTLLTLCPFCIHNFKDAAQTFNIEINIANIFDLLLNLLP